MLIENFREDRKQCRWLRPYLLAFGLSMMLIGLAERFGLTELLF